LQGWLPPLAEGAANPLSPAGDWESAVSSLAGQLKSTGRQTFSCILWTPDGFSWHFKSFWPRNVALHIFYSAKKFSRRFGEELNLQTPTPLKYGPVEERCKLPQLQPNAF